MRTNETMKTNESAAYESSQSFDLKRAVVEFAHGASTEISTHDEEMLLTLANKLPAGTPVYVAHTPKATLAEVVQLAIKVQAIGLRASPHIVARRLASEHALKSALSELTDAGVEQVLLVAGDLEKPLGKFTSTLDIIESGALQNAGLKRVGVAGHPEGHKAVGPGTLLAALRHKQEFASRTGIKVHIVTQFGFNPDTIVAWGQQLTREGIALPVHVGIAGPTPLPKLIKFAMACGVGASLNSLMGNLKTMANLARLATTPDEMLAGLVRGQAAHSGSRLVQPHFYSFGGVAATARWMRAVVDGNFEVNPDGGKFVMDA
ncbi:MAG: methylenetetrahydrofolate reductase [Gammaproteobacteria bacterium]|nr:methylenetetrahydrofolate reductase [Gammaproteobacteria bacterium]